MPLLAALQNEPDPEHSARARERGCVDRDSNSGHQLLLPPAQWCPIFACPDHAGRVASGGADCAALALGGRAVNANRALRASKREWGQEFRRKINEFVYRRGNGSDPQE